jgi:hypothetical protein
MKEVKSVGYAKDVPLNTQKKQTAPKEEITLHK